MDCLRQRQSAVPDAYGDFVGIQLQLQRDNQVSFLRRMSAFQFQLNYTWSHALDYVSNAGRGITPFNFNTNTSITARAKPLRCPSEHVWQCRLRHSPLLQRKLRVYDAEEHVQQLPGKFLGDWTVAGTIFARTGLPFTVVDSGTGGVFASYGYGGANLNGVIFADQTGGNGLQCGSQFANPTNGSLALTSNFAASVTGFGNQRRNQVFGPHFFDTDLTISKAFPIPHWESGRILVGVSAFNLFNHPNFDQPSGDVVDPNFGNIVSTVNGPTSIYGSFLGADSSPRLIQTFESD